MAFVSQDVTGGATPAEPLSGLMSGVVACLYGEICPRICVPCWIMSDTVRARAAVFLLYRIGRVS